VLRPASTDYGCQIGNNLGSFVACAFNGCAKVLCVCGQAQGDMICNPDNVYICFVYATCMRLFILQSCMAFEYCKTRSGARHEGRNVLCVFEWLCSAQSNITGARMAPPLYCVIAATTMQNDSCVHELKGTSVHCR